MVQTIVAVHLNGCLVSKLLYLDLEKGSKHVPAVYGRMVRQCWHRSTLYSLVRRSICSRHVRERPLHETSNNVHVDHIVVLPIECDK